MQCPAVVQGRRPHETVSVTVLGQIRQLIEAAVVGRRSALHSLATPRYHVRVPDWVDRFAGATVWTVPGGCVVIGARRVRGNGRCQVGAWRCR